MTTEYLGDLEIIVSDKPVDVKRTWKERLFTKPWAPGIAIKKVSVPPDGKVTRLPGGMILMNPRTRQMIDHAITTTKGD